MNIIRRFFHYGSNALPQYKKPPPPPNPPRVCCNNNCNQGRECPERKLRENN